MRLPQQLSQWVRDLTEEGVERQPGPVTPPGMFGVPAGSAFDISCLYATAVHTVEYQRLQLTVLGTIVVPVIYSLRAYRRARARN